MIKILISIFATVLTTLAFAGDLNGSSTLPTTYTTGEPLTTTGPESLAALRWEYGTCSGSLFGTKTGESIVPVPATGVTFTGLSPGTYCLRAFARLVNGTESLAASNVASKTILSRVPSPPVITASTGVAFTVIKQVDRFVMLPVGTVPNTTPCDPAQSVNGYNVVPRSAVTWAGNVRPDVVVAQCS